MSRHDPRPMARSTIQIFAVPILIAVLSIVGLVGALTGDGWRDAISWIGLAVPVVVTGWAWRGRTR